MDPRPGKILNTLVALPLFLFLLFTSGAFHQGNPGFRIDKTQRGLLISHIFSPVNPVEENDLIVAIDGINYNQMLGSLLISGAVRSQHKTVTVLRGEKRYSFPLKTIPLTLKSFFRITWPKLLLVSFFLSLATLARNRAPDSIQVNLFFIMLCGFSTSLTATLASSFALLTPGYISASFLTLTLSNWVSFAVWIHFAARFPADRDILGDRKWPLFLIYLLPPVFITTISLVQGNSSHSFWCWLQRLRNLFLPASILLAFLKHLWDYQQTDSPLARNQIKLPLIAYWLTFTPYFFFYLLPNLFLDHPLISFRTVVFAFFILPLAYISALLRYRLFDVDRLISRAVSFVVSIILLGSLYSLFLSAIKRFFFGKQVLSEELFLLFFIIMFFAFRPISNFLEGWINRIFFRYRPVPTELLHQFSDKISATLFFDDIIQAMVEELPPKINVYNITLILLDEKQSRLFPKQKRFSSRLWRNSALVLEFQDYSPVCIHTDHPGRTHRQEKELQEIRRAGYSLIFPMKSIHKVTGLLLAGFRNDGRQFSSEDILLIAALANQGAIAIENARRYEALIASKQEIEILFSERVQQEKLAILGEMTAKIAHELKTPLGIINSSAQYLAKGRLSQEIQDEMIQYILEETIHLEESITDLLGLAKQRPPRFEQVDISRELNGFVQRWKQNCDHNQHVTIHIKTDKYLPPLYADMRLLNQVLFNLIRNSEEAMPNGGNISLHARSDKQTMTISILDNGPGIVGTNEKELFKKFYTTKKKGIGLGLAICRQIIQAHNGVIRLDNRKNGGAKAVISLPLKPLTTVNVPEFTRKTAPADNEKNTTH